MAKLPKKLKLTPHARTRLQERKDPDIQYDTRDLMKSSCKWFTTKDFIEKSKLYQHSLYVCRKSIQMGYLTNGKVEVLYNKGTGVAITVMEVKEKFLPITQYIKPDILGEINKKKRFREMKKKQIGLCSDCGEEVELDTAGLCKRCKNRKMNMKHRGKEYIRYLDLSDEEKIKVDNARKRADEIYHDINDEEEKEIKIPDLSVPENYYQMKAEHQTNNNEQKKYVTVKSISNPLEDYNGFINSLRECGCMIPEIDLKNILNVLLATDKLKDILLTIAKDSNQKALLDLEQILNVGERKLQHDWEYNGFQEEDDIKFKAFLTWRRTLKSAIYFWKRLYQTNTLIEMQRAWDAYLADPTEKVVLSRDVDKVESILKRFQITTESISTIFNTKRPFTRVFYAKNKEDAYSQFIKWMSDRQLHENKSKTIITELNDTK